MGYYHRVDRAKKLEDIIDETNSKIESIGMTTEENAIDLLMRIAEKSQMKNFVALLVSDDIIKHESNENERYFFLERRNIPKSYTMEKAREKIREFPNKNTTYFMIKDLVKEGRMFVYALNIFEDYGKIKRWNKTTYYIEDIEFFKKEIKQINTRSKNLTKEEIDDYLVMLGIPYSELEKIRKEKDVRNRLKMAGKLLKKRNININSMELAMILYGGNWKNTSITNLNFLLKRVYNCNEYPNIHCFRKEFGIYVGNVDDVRKEHPEITFSDKDLERNVRLPINLNNGNGKRIKQLIGIIIGDGYIHSSNGKSIVLIGSKYDWQFYRTVVPRLIFDILNYEIFPKQHSKSRNVPEITINSEAIVKWYENIVIPNLESLVGNKYVMEGIFASMANIQSKRIIRFNDKDEWKINFIYDSLKSLSYDPHINHSRAKTSKGTKEYRHIDIYPKEYQRALEEFGSLNPRHRRIRSEIRQ
jgi:hypothetical protein